MVILQTLRISLIRTLKCSTASVHAVNVVTRVNTMATIAVDKPRSLVDQPIAIQLAGLPSNVPLTVELRIRESYGTFSAYGHYTSDSSGNLELASCASSGGTYTGKDGMGLFWSLRQDPSARMGLRLLRREAEIPLRYQLTAYPGHVTWERLSQSADAEELTKKLCSVALERTYLDESVVRIPIKFGRLRGSLFKPRLLNAYPPVIDLFGTGGGLMEHRAALLAKEGFSVLSLAFFNYQDLQKNLTEIDMDYFEEAIDYMLSSPYSKTANDGTSGVVMIGTSTGADIVANAGILFGSKIRSVVWLNGTLCRSWFPVRYRGRLLPNYHPIDVSLVESSPTPPGLSFREALRSCSSPERELPVELASCSFLFLSCLDDYSTNPDTGARFAERLRLAGRKDFSHVAYPDAGHLLEPPISPCTSLAYHGVFGMFIYNGGKPFEHHRAQTDAWDRIIAWVKAAFDVRPPARL